MLTPAMEVLARPGVSDLIEQTMARVGPPMSLDVDLDDLLGPR